jgi:K+/H+ antiporter YhaU regulatory subunit KhtT
MKGCGLMGRTRIENPVYQQIAVDIAAKIVNGKYQVGEKIKGRSTLASYYNVSPETIRKAMCILEDVGIVSVRPGVGVEITSMENSREFIKKYNDVSNLNSIKKNILDMIQTQNEQAKKLKETVNELLDCTERFKDLNPFTPFEVEITKDAKYLGKTVSEINFWQNTLATIIAIKRNGKIILSPGSYATLKENDILYIIASEESYNRVKMFLY